jgi:spore maturation protein SpmA
MALNYIWIAFFLIAFVIAFCKLVFFGDVDAFKLLVDGMFDSSKSSVMDIALPLAGNMVLWLGILNIGERAGAMNFLSRIVGPFLSRLFPEVPKKHPATGQMMMNFSANLLGLDNAATPLGLKAMSSLQELNPNKETASNAQIMFLVLHTSGLQLLPVTIIAQRFILHAKDPADVLIPCIIATYVATVVGMIAVAIKQKINLFDRVIVSWLGGMTAFIALLVYYFTNYLDKEQITIVSKVASNLLLFAIPTVFILAKIRNAVQGLPGVKIAVAQEASGLPVQKDISIEIIGDDLDSLVKTGSRLKTYLNKQNIAGIENLVADVQSDKPDIVFDIDRERANREGISTSQINQNLGTAIFGAKAADFRNTKEDDYQIKVRAMEEQRSNIDELRNLKITYRDLATGGAIRQVPISAFTDIRYTNTFSNIKRKQQRRVLTLGSSVIKPYNPNDVNANILRAIKNFRKDDSIVIRQGGGQEDQMEAVNFLGGAMATSFGLILIILMLQFNSIGKTFIIISEIFLSIIGVFLGVSIFGMTMSIVMTGIGIIALAGVVVRNGILLVEFTDMLIAQGVSLHDAVVEAGHTRMTPVLLTATAAILGLIPLAVGFNIDFVGLFTHFNPHIHFGGDNVAFWGPLAWTMIFGLGFATVITLILVPCMYIIRVNMKNYFFGKKEKIKEPEYEAIEA